MILHIPHASTNTLDKEFLCDLELELERMTDHQTDELFNYRNAKKVIFPISRLICDVERFEDDSLEIMAAKGMGVCYTTNSFGNPLRKLMPNEREEILNQYYRPHHKELTDAVNKELEIFGKALIIDCHSFSNEPLPHEDSQTTPRPDFCIGTDSFHTPEWLINTIKEYLEFFNFTVSINDPFSGTLIPMEHYQKDERVKGIMIEVNRALYADKFYRFKDIIIELLDSIEQAFYFRDIDTHINVPAIEELYKNPSAPISIFEVFDSMDWLWDNTDFFVAYTFYDLANFAEKENIYEYAYDEYELDYGEPLTETQKYETAFNWLMDSFEDDGSKDCYVIIYKKIELTDEKTVYLALIGRNYDSQEWSIENDLSILGIFNSFDEILNHLETQDYYFNDVEHKFGEAFWSRFRKDVIENWYFNS